MGGSGSRDGDSLTGSGRSVNKKITDRPIFFRLPLSNQNLTEAAQTKCRNSRKRQDAASTYVDTPGFCKNASTVEIAGHGYVLTPGRYVGAEEIEDDGEPFEEK